MISNDEGTKALLKALEVSMYYGDEKSRVQHNLVKLLMKLGVKSTRTWGADHRFESLSAVLKNVTFDDSKLKLWKDIK